MDRTTQRTLILILVSHVMVALMWLSVTGGN